MRQRKGRGQMRFGILGLMWLACATSAEAADAWTCTYPFLNDRREPDNAFVRFEIATPDLIETKAPTNLVLPTPQGVHYRILQNNDYGLVATFAESGIPEGAKDPYVGATSVVINKMTSQFYWTETKTTKDERRITLNSSNGRCRYY
jgi:hypothetical protein